MTEIEFLELFHEDEVRFIADKKHIPLADAAGRKKRKGALIIQLTQNFTITDAINYSHIGKMIFFPFKILNNVIPQKVATVSVQPEGDIHKIYKRTTSFDNFFFVHDTQTNIWFACIKPGLMTPNLQLVKNSFRDAFPNVQESDIDVSLSMNITASIGNKVNTFSQNNGIVRFPATPGIVADSYILFHEYKADFDDEFATKTYKKGKVAISTRPANQPYEVINQNGLFFSMTGRRGPIRFNNAIFNGIIFNNIHNITVDMLFQWSNQTNYKLLRFGIDKRYGFTILNTDGSITDYGKVLPIANI